MTAHASADPTSPAAHFAQQVLRSLLDGSPLPVTLPEADYGPWAETVHALRGAHAQGGRDAAHRAFVAMSRQEPALVSLLTGAESSLVKTTWTVAELYAARCQASSNCGYDTIDTSLCRP